MIFDGEILGWDLEGRRGRCRLRCWGRGSGGSGFRMSGGQQVPVVFMAFDLMFAGGELLLELPLRERRNRLEAVVERLVERVVSPVMVDERARDAQAVLFAGAESEAVERLMISPSRLVESAEDIERAYAEARARANEGVMLKAAGSVYQPGRRGLAWVKLKRELATLDVVVTGAEFGHGKRAGILSDYTFAVRGDGWRVAECGEGLLGADGCGDCGDERVDDGAYAGGSGILSDGRAADGAGGGVQQHYAEWAACERVCAAVSADSADQDGQAGGARSIRWSGWRRSISRRWISRWSPGLIRRTPMAEG